MNAMEEFDRKLRLFQEQMAQKNQLEARRRSLQKQRGPLEEKERDLRRRLYAEQADVDRLNRRSLAALFYACLLYTSRCEQCGQHHFHLR